MSLCACLCVHELTEGWSSSVKCVMLGRGKRISSQDSTYQSEFSSSDWASRLLLICCWQRFRLWILSEERALVCCWSIAGRRKSIKKTNCSFFVNLPYGGKTLIYVAKWTRTKTTAHTSIKRDYSPTEITGQGSKVTRVLLSCILLSIVLDAHTPKEHIMQQSRVLFL